MTSWCIWKCKMASLGFRFCKPGCFQKTPSVPPFAALYWQNSSCRCLEGCFQILLVGEINFVKLSMNFAVTHGTEPEKCFPVYDGGSRYHMKQWFGLLRCPSALGWLSSTLALLALLIPNFFALQLCGRIFYLCSLYLLVLLKLLLQPPLVTQSWLNTGLFSLLGPSLLACPQRSAELLKCKWNS